MNPTALVPSASRLMHSLRDIGYDLSSAVADIVDNSIDALATRIDIIVCWKGAESFIAISDDGGGMTPARVTEAMRYGSARRYAEHELGKFGLGLKTASLSQCRRLTVGSRSNPRGRMAIRRWDLDAIRESDAWMLESLRSKDLAPYLQQMLPKRRGTIVVWEKLDRVLAYATPDGARAQRALELAADQIAEHVSMVFHRFIDGETASGRKVEIFLNGKAIRAWDPFARTERATRSLAEHFIAFEASGASFEMRVKPFVLPSQIAFSSAEAHARAAGPRLWNRQQGFYIYRGDRLLQSGGWNRLRTSDEHSKLARIAIDIPSGADDAFQINVAKMRVSLPEQLRPTLRVLAAAVAGEAQEAYRRRLRVVEPAAKTEPRHDTAALADIWPELMRIAQGVLAEHPQLRDELLLAFANSGLQSAAAETEAI